MKKIIALLFALMLCVSSVACTPKPTETAAVSGVEDGVLTVAMECAYAPYNWTQPTDANGAVPIKDSNEFANGYDVMMAKKLCEANGWELEVVRLDWDSLIPAVQTGQIDAVIAGQSSVGSSISTPSATSCVPGTPRTASSGCTRRDNSCRSARVR